MGGCNKQHCRIKDSENTRNNKATSYKLVSDIGRPLRDMNSSRWLWSHVFTSFQHRRTQPRVSCLNQKWGVCCRDVVSPIFLMCKSDVAGSLLWCSSIKPDSDTPICYFIRTHSETVILSQFMGNRWWHSTFVLCLCMMKAIKKRGEMYSHMCLCFLVY